MSMILLLNYLGMHCSFYTNLQWFEDCREQKTALHKHLQQCWSLAQAMLHYIEIRQQNLHGTDYIQIHFVNNLN